MSCKSILEKLSVQFATWSCSKHNSCSKTELENRASGMQLQEEFLRKYPFNKKSSAINRSLVNRETVHEFLVWLIYTLRPLGGIQAVFIGPTASKIARNLGQMHDFLNLAVDPDVNLAQKIDAWDDPRSPGDRLVAKKIIATYLAEQVVPVFSQEDMEHFIGYLGRNKDRDDLSHRRHKASYNDLTRGQKFALLNDILLDSKAHHPDLVAEDNVYFMYCLYSGSSRPSRMKEWRGHAQSRHARVKAPSPQITRKPKVAQSDPTTAVAELQTGIKSGQRFCDSVEARKAIEDRAIERATEYLRREKGWPKVRDVSPENRGYDLHCKRGRNVLMVEVKGTTAHGNEVLLTPNEVRHARDKHPKVALYVVSGISLSQQPGSEIKASGGEVRGLDPWALDDGTLIPMAYKYSMPLEPSPPPR